MSGMGSSRGHDHIFQIFLENNLFLQNLSQNEEKNCLYKIWVKMTRMFISVKSESK